MACSIIWRIPFTRPYRNMASVCDEMLLLETIICDHEMALVRVENKAQTSTRHWVESPGDPRRTTLSWR